MSRFLRLDAQQAVSPVSHNTQRDQLVARLLVVDGVGDELAIEVVAELVVWQVQLSQMCVTSDGPRRLEQSTM